LALVKAAERDGEFFRAYDLARQGMAAHPDDLPLRHRAVLVLARSGATEQAQALYRELGLEGRQEPDLPELEARLLKDIALAAPDGEERVRLLLTAAEKYETAYDRSGHYYPGINVANLMLLAGQPERAAAIARPVSGAPAGAHGRPMRARSPGRTGAPRPCKARLIRAVTTAARRPSWPGLREARSGARPQQFSSVPTSRERPTSSRSRRQAVST